jgi:signal transduction histidine kinase/CheY-like chemotaxis protein
MTSMPAIKRLIARLVFREWDAKAGTLEDQRQIQVSYALILGLLFLSGIVGIYELVFGSTIIAILLFSITFSCILADLLNPKRQHIVIISNILMPALVLLCATTVLMGDQRTLFLLSWLYTLPLLSFLLIGFKPQAHIWALSPVFLSIVTWSVNDFNINYGQVNFHSLDAMMTYVFVGLTIYSIAYFLATSIEKYRKYFEEKEWEFEREIEKRKIAERKALEASEAKNLFLANMSHELRTPLNAMSAAIHLLQDSKLDKSQRHYALTLARSSRFLLQLINDVLDISKIEAGHMEVVREDFYLDDLVENLAELFAGPAHDQKIQLIFDVDPSLPFAIEGDLLRLQQVLTNLIGNAIKFTNEGLVRINVSKGHLPRGVDAVAFEVIDSGIGINNEQLETIFGSFSQEDLTTTRNFGGTGLGLSISRKLVRLMGGDLNVVSQKGSGSTFFFKVPLKNAHSLAQRRHHLLENASVLLLLDVGIEAQVVARALSRSCKRAYMSHQLEEAQMLMASSEFDHIIISQDWLQDGRIDQYYRIQALAKEHDIQIDLICDFDRDIEEIRQHGEFRHLFFRPISRFDFQVDESVEHDEELKALFNEKKILLVDDNQVNLMLLAALLKKVGVNVTKASSGKLALEKLAEHEFDLVVMDVQMPDMDGLQATKLIRKELQLNVPVVAFTANAMEADKRACYDAGMNDFLTKPVEYNMLIAVLSRWLKKTL